MAVMLSRLSCWLWGKKEGNESSNSTLNSSSSDFPSGYREMETLKFPSLSSSRRIRKKCESKKEERRVRIDKEFDVVIVPPDGGCFSGSESDGSDWSIGWMEPHDGDFQTSDGEEDGSFAVLVPCYGRGRCEKKEGLKSQALGAVNQHYGFSNEGTDFMERWLSSLHDM